MWGVVTRTPNVSEYMLVLALCLVLTSGDCYLYATFGENRSRNATVNGESADRTEKTEFIICPMLYAIAMGQIKSTI